MQNTSEIAPIYIQMDPDMIIPSEHDINENTVDDFYNKAQEQCMDAIDYNIYMNIMLIYANSLIKNGPIDNGENLRIFINAVINTGSQYACVCSITRHLLMVFLVDFHEINNDLVERTMKSVLVEYGAREARSRELLTSTSSRINDIFQRFMAEFTDIKPDTITDDEFNTLKKTDIAGLKELLQQKGHDTSDIICNICQDTYEDDDSIVMLPCSDLHHFHEDCIKKWVTESHAKCPLCKADVIKESEDNTY